MVLNFFKKCYLSKKVFLKYVFFIILFIYLLTKPNLSFANPLLYTYIVSINGDRIVLETRGLENKSFSECNLIDLNCINLAEKPLPITNSTSPSYKYTVKFPVNSTRRNISTTGHYGFYTKIDSLKKTRTLGIIDAKSKKAYTNVNTLNFWNLFDQQPHIARFSPDEKNMAYVDDRSGFMSLYVVPLKSLNNKSFGLNKVTSDVSVGDFMFASPDTIVYVANTKTDPYNWTLYSYNLATKIKNPLVDHLAYDTILHQFNNSIIFEKITPFGTEPVVLSDYKGGFIKIFNLLTPNPTNTDTISYSYQKIVGFDTVLMKNIKTLTLNQPLIVWLHGGPFRQSSFTRHPYISYGVYDWVLEEAVNKGAQVLKIDYPGSYGSGRKLSESVKGGVGTTDIDSVMKVITNFTKTHSNIDQVYLVGNSYGGYLAGKALASYPTKINGGLSINGVTDWKSLLLFYKNSIFNTFFNGLPTAKNKKLFTQASIIDNVKLYEKPLYIVQGEVDSTIPKFQAILLKKALDEAGKTSTLTLIPDENHVFLKNSSLNTICQTLFKMVNLDVSNSCHLEG